MSETCIHESDLAELRTTVPEMNKKLDRVLGILDGNGRAGLSTRVAVIEKEMKNTPSAKALAFYASCGGGFVVIVAMLAQWAV